METSGAISAGPFKATQQWKELLRHILAQSTLPSRRSTKSQDQAEDTVRCNGKSLQAAIANFLSKNLENFAKQPEPDAAQRLGQQLLDSGAFVADYGQRFEAKSSRWYRLNSSSPCVLPFLDFIGQLTSCDNNNNNNDNKQVNSPLSSSNQTQQSHKKTPIAARLQRSFGRVLESRQRRFRDQLTRMSCRASRSRSWSCMPPSLAAAEAAVDSHTASVDRRDRPVSAIEKSIRNDFYSSQQSAKPALSLDFYIHQLCLHRLLKMIDLPIIDELLHSEKLNQPARPVASDFLNLDDSFGGSSHSSRRPLSQQQQQPQQQQQQYTGFLASQVARGLNSLGAFGCPASQLDAELCLRQLPQLLAKSADPLGWLRLSRVFHALLTNYTHCSANQLARSNNNIKVLQLSFCLLELEQRQLSENVLLLIRSCCQGNVRSQRASALLPQLAELLIPNAAMSSITGPVPVPPSTYRQRQHRLFIEMLDKCEILFRVPSDIFNCARMLRLRRYQPELLLHSVYCCQISADQLRRVTKETTEKAVKELMDNLLHDPKVSHKVKEAKLRQLKQHHSDIYAKHFANFKF